MRTHIIELLAANWKFAIGRQNTIRLGTKWAHNVDPGDVLVFIDENLRTTTYTCTDIAKMFWCNIDETICRRNHVNAGLVELGDARERAYGRKWDRGDIMRVIECE